MSRENVETYQEFAKHYYATKDPAHDFRHIRRIFGRLNELSEGLWPAPRLDRLYFLAAFHELGVRLRADGEFQDKVRRFLKRLGWTEEEVDNGFESLARHLKDPQTIEEQVVHDANHVEMFGALGVAKAFTTGGARGQAYEVTADIFEHRYLDRVEFRTPAGKRIAEERKTYARQFLARLRAEL
jgi:uncharacterized protein